MPIEITFRVPTITELIARFSLTPSQWSRVYDDHDDGDEQPRRHARFVCSLRRGRECWLDPNHWGPHEHESRRQPG